jgi:Na+/H+-dicarboxylate symporter
MIGVGIAVFMNPARIPLVAGAEAVAVPGLKEVLRAVFTDNMFAVLGSAGGYLLPLLVLAVVLGLAFCHDRIVTKPAVTLFDSFSRIFYQINSFFAEFMGILLIAASIQALSSVLAGLNQTIYRPLLITIGMEILLATFVIIPAILWFFGGHKNPFPTLYGLAAPALASLVSGDVYFSMGVLQKHAKENLGIRRRSNALAIPFAILFGRAGTALVTSTSFIVILSSFSDLGISTSSLLWILAMTPLLTLIVGAAPRNGAMTALMALCALYGRGFNNGYLIIVPIAFPLIAAGSFIDTIWAGCANLIIARKDGLCAEKERRFYI